MKTYTAKKGDIKRVWYLVDAKDKTLGRLASQVAQILRGKHKPTYTPNIDTGDFVIVINAARVRLTGDKLEKKKYYHHSGYPSGLKEKSYQVLMEEKPAFVVEKAVWGMLPHNRLGRAIIKKLKVYEGEEHPHQVQNPKPLEL